MISGINHPRQSKQRASHIRIPQPAVGIIWTKKTEIIVNCLHFYSRHSDKISKKFVNSFRNVTERTEVHLLHWPSNIKISNCTGTTDYKLHGSAIQSGQTLEIEMWSDARFQFHLKICASHKKVLQTADLYFPLFYKFLISDGIYCFIRLRYIKYVRNLHNKLGIAIQTH